jgi:hypothetical protein
MKVFTTLFFRPINPLANSDTDYKKSDIADGSLLLEEIWSCIPLTTPFTNVIAKQP